MGLARTRLQIPVLLVMGGLSSHARAQMSAEVRSAEDRLEGDATEIGDTNDALPGVARIGVPGVKAPRAAVAIAAGYGFTEGQNGDKSPHHRVGSSLAGAIAPWSFAALGLRVDFRHDMHGKQGETNDSGSVLDFTPHVRFGSEVSDGVHLGAEARLRLPGATVGGSGPSPEFDGRGLFAYSGVPSWLFALHAGYRLGHGGSVIEDASNMRAGDRVALGISEFDAVLLGLGAVKTVNKTDVFAEMTSEMLLGGGAPSFVESPLRVALGARHALGSHLWLNALLEVSPGSRAPSAPGDALVPVEPRVQGTIGVIWRFLVPPKPQVPDEPEPVVEKPVEEKPGEPVEDAPPPAITSTLRVTVVDKTGHPISDAQVQVHVPKTNTSPEATLDVPLEDRNLYTSREIPVGEVDVIVKAELLKEETHTVTIVEGQPAEIEIKLSPSATLGSQLRGLVRSYSGQGIAASVRVEPGDHATNCQEDGSFVLDLPPGSYKVIIEAEGYRSQQRSLRVRKEGVTVLNADLQESAE